MCTLALAWQVFAETPVAVAANRDEATDRPSEPPSRRGGDDGAAFVAPRDREAGGTWTGYNEHGLYVGLTNRWVGGLAGERSRGLLVDDALRRESAEAAARLVESAVERDEYEGFEAVLADERAAFLLEWDGRLTVTRLDPGVHVVVNVGAA
ncbi:MAG: NRDE family protein, partial [Haloferacaceae archaeon]